MRDVESTYWNGACDVCGATGPVTEARDYGFLWKGIAKLEGKNSLTDMAQEVRYSMKISEIFVSREDQFGRLGTVVRIDDEGGGEFITLSDTDGNEFRLDFEEYDMVIQAVRKLRDQ